MPFTPIGSEFLVNTTTNGIERPTDAFALIDGRIVTTYYTAGLTVSSGFAKIWNTDGTESVAEFAIDTADLLQHVPIKGAALPNGGFVLVWAEPIIQDGTNLSTLKAQLFGANGGATSGEITVASSVVSVVSTTDDQFEVSVRSNGGFAVTWRSDPDEDGDVQFGNPDVARLRVFDAAGDALTGEIDASGGLGGQDTTPSIAALSNGNLVVTWMTSDETVPDFNDAIITRIFSSSGVAQGGATLVSQSDLGNHGFPTVTALEGDRYVVVWVEGFSLTHANFASIFAQYFDNSGTAQGSKFQVSTPSDGLQFHPSVVALEGGGFAVAYSDSSITGMDDSGFAVRMTAFDGNGGRIADEIEVNTTTLADQFLPFIAATPEGDITVVWTDNTGLDGQDGFAGGGVGQRFSLEVAPSTTPTPGDDIITGTSAGEFLFALAGNDEIYGLEGNDEIDGGAGDDLIDGGAGDDQASYVSASGAVQAYLSFGLSRGADGRDTFVSIESLFGSSFGDRLVGDGGDNSLFGDDGDDILKGKGGSDLLNGGAGDDRITGGDDVDSLIGETGSDILFALGGNDTLYGDAGDDFLYGGRGADALFGGADADRLRGNRDQDLLMGQEGSDDLRGGGGNDTLSGGADVDFLFGDNGNDQLDGGTGADSLTGGGGADQFVFAAGYGFDRVKDFEDGSDLIDLTAFGLATFAGDVSGLASDASGGMRLNFGGGDVLFLEGFSVAQFDASDVLLA